MAGCLRLAQGPLAVSEALLQLLPGLFSVSRGILTIHWLLSPSACFLEPQGDRGWKEGHGCPVRPSPLLKPCV